MSASRSRTVDGAARVALVGSLAVVAAATLIPTGWGWRWASPMSELRWYLAGLESEETVLQLGGNLALFAVPAALAVVLWPALARPARLMAAALAAGSSIEVLQWLLPLGRVVSPLDAVLNATGAVLAGLIAARLRDRFAARWQAAVHW
jgi:glycopeptide antibiotics resistance protein